MTRKKEGSENKKREKEKLPRKNKGSKNERKKREGERERERKGEKLTRENEGSENKK